VKLTIPAGKSIDTLILNGAECEPFLTTDHRVMLEQREDIFTGIRYLRRVTGAGRVIIGVESNKADAAEHLRAGVSAGLSADVPVEVEVLSVKYPQGAEKVLIAAVLAARCPRAACRRRSCAGREHRDGGGDRPFAAARPRHSGAGDHGRRPGGSQEGQLPDPIGTRCASCSKRSESVRACGASSSAGR